MGQRLSKETFEAESQMKRSNRPGECLGGGGGESSPERRAGTSPEEGMTSAYSQDRGSVASKVERGDKVKSEK